MQISINEPIEKASESAKKSFTLKKLSQSITSGFRSVGSSISATANTVLDTTPRKAIMAPVNGVKAATNSVSQYRRRKRIENAMNVLASEAQDLVYKAMSESIDFKD